jgi:hypothetical protein
MELSQLLLELAVQGAQLELQVVQVGPQLFGLYLLAQLQQKLTHKLR